MPERVSDNQLQAVPLTERNAGSPLSQVSPPTTITHHEWLEIFQSIGEGASVESLRPLQIIRQARMRFTRLGER